MAPMAIDEHANGHANGNANGTLNAKAAAYCTSRLLRNLYHQCGSNASPQKYVLTGSRPAAIRAVKTRAGP